MTAPDHRHRPRRDFGHLPLGSLAAAQPLEYEREHANRPQGGYQP